MPGKDPELTERIRNLEARVKVLENIIKRMGMPLERRSLAKIEG